MFGLDLEKETSCVRERATVNIWARLVIQWWFRRFAFGFKLLQIWVLKRILYAWKVFSCCSAGWVYNHGLWPHILAFKMKLFLKWLPYKCLWWLNITSWELDLFFFFLFFFFISIFKQVEELYFSLWEVAELCNESRGFSKLLQ